MKWKDLDQKIPDCTLARLMDEVAEELGIYPKWDDEVPKDIENLCGI